MKNATKYIDESRLPYDYCPGCGHGRIVDALNAALTKLELDPCKIVIVTDIGCVGLSDKYFLTNSLHGLHGRSLTYATGVKLANPGLKVIVLIGDGGCGIGGGHLLNAARRNIGITTLVFNNFNYGMTGGQHSVTTPLNGYTATTRYGQLEQPMDICGTVAINGASFVARTTAFDKALAELIFEAIQNEGFSLVDIWELCTAYYVPNNHFSKQALEKTLDDLGFVTGILKNDQHPEFSQAYHAAVADQFGKPAMPAVPIESKYDHGLDRRYDIIIAGAAGMKIGSAAALLAQGAIFSGLWATQRNDYPVTVKSGHSISEIVLSPQEILYTGISKPNLMVVLFAEGFAKVKRFFPDLTPRDILFISSDLPPVETRAQKIILDFKEAGLVGRKKENWAMMAMASVLAETGIYPLAALKEAIAINSRYVEQNLEALEVGIRILTR
ncbi:MAG: thiamine pyrophosphate-dependent enzyme [Anaerolineales bacterium]